MASGRVKWFNNAKGYGFILPDDGGADLFAHYTSIEMEGYKTLKAGQAVDFDIINGDKGSHAVKIMPSDDIQAPVENDSSGSVSNDNSSTTNRLETA